MKKLSIGIQTFAKLRDPESKKYMAGNRTVYIVGVGLDSEEKNISGFAWGKV